MGKTCRQRAVSILVACALGALASTDVLAESSTENIAELYHTPSERRDIADLKLNGISIGALLEVEATFGREHGEVFSDVTLATVELGIDAILSEWAEGHVLVLWEEDATEPVDLDEGFITLGDGGSCPYSLQIGKMYVPFGRFKSHFISDPLMLELPETRESAALVGYDNEAFSVSVGVFNGAVDGTDDDDHAGDLVAALSVQPAENIEVGAYWVSDLGESDGLEELVRAALSEADGGTYSTVGGLAGSSALLSVSLWSRASTSPHLIRSMPASWGWNSERTEAGNA